MALPATYASGTRSTTVTTEHFESSPNAVGTYVFSVDLVNMAAGDVMELRVYKMVLTGGTARVVQYMRYAGAQPTDDLIKMSLPVATGLAEANGLRFSMKHTLGTTINVPWSVEQWT